MEFSGDIDNNDNDHGDDGEDEPDQLDLSVGARYVITNFCLVRILILISLH